MLSTIAKPFGWLLMWLYEFVGNYGWAVIIFALIVKLILLPFMAKSRRSTMRTSRLQPMIQEIQKKYAGNQVKINAETQKLYKEEKINPMSGCIWSLIPFPILIALYQAIRFPLTIMMGVPEALIKEGGAIFEKLTSMGFESAGNAAYGQIAQAQFISNHFADFAPLSEKLKSLDYSFLGIDLGAQPQWKFLWSTDWGDPSVWVPGLGLFLIPIIAAVLTYFTSKISQKMNPTSSNPDDPSAKTANTMMLLMPVMTIWFAFMMPAALGIYWIASSFFGIFQDIILSKSIKKQMAIEDAARNERIAAKEAELEAKRLETERLKALGATNVNPNTAKRRQQVKERQEQEARRAEWERTHKPKPQKDALPSQVGNRKYARGRAYMEERFEAGSQESDTASETVEMPETPVEMPVQETPARDEAAYDETPETDEDYADETYPDEDEDSEDEE